MSAATSWVAHQPGAFAKVCERLAGEQSQVDWAHVGHIHVKGGTRPLGWCWFHEAVEAASLLDPGLRQRQDRFEHDVLGPAFLGAGHHVDGVHEELGRDPRLALVLAEAEQAEKQAIEASTPSPAHREAARASPRRGGCRPGSTSPVPAGAAA